MKNILVVIALFFIAFVFSISDYDSKNGRVYDCGMAEWHPDIPKEVKDECRKRHLEEKSKTKLLST